MAYSDAQKAIAIELARRNNGVLDAFTLADIRAKISAPNVSAPIVRRWLAASTKQKVAQEKTPIEAAAGRALDQMFEDLARSYLEHAAQDHVKAKLGGKDAVTAAAIAVDKMRLLRDLPTVIINAAPELTALGKFLEQHQIPASALFQDLLFDLQAQTNVEQDAESGE